MPKKVKPKKKVSFKKSAPKKRKVLRKKIVKKISKKKVLRRKRGPNISQEQINLVIKKGSDRGFVTTSEVLSVIPDIEYDVEGLDNVYDILKERGIEIKEAQEFLQLQGKKGAKAKKPIIGKIDPIQIYLKEIGRSSFLSAKEEKELAKRI